MKEVFTYHFTFYMKATDQDETLSKHGIGISSRKECYTPIIATSHIAALEAANKILLWCDYIPHEKEFLQVSYVSDGVYNINMKHTI